MTNVSRNPYQVLQVPVTADASAIKAAYRRLAWRHHPDRGGDAALMMALNEAWSILGAPRKRARLDALRGQCAAPSRPTSAAPPAPPPSARAKDVLDFGRYAGSSLAEIAVCDPDYLEWLVRMPIGHAFEAEVERLLAPRRAAAAARAAAPAPRPRRRFRR